MIDTALLPAFRRTLVSGDYNLLVGSGISLDSRNKRGDLLHSAEALRTNLCALKRVSPRSSLSRVAQLLTPEEVQEYLVEPYSGCTPGDSLRFLPDFLWKRLFTFNVDDVVEHLYQSASAKQVLATINFNALLEPSPERRVLQAVHLHGWVGDPDARFVFSREEYALVMRDLNPWMSMLSQVLATEAFIVAGTSLDEPDLEFYLSRRTAITPRRDRGPSLLIEPYPDAGTRAECERHGLLLVEAKFEDFLDWLHQQVPNAPTITELLVPNDQALFDAALSPADRLRFFADFELVSGTVRAQSATPTAYMYGREPRWEEIEEHTDIERTDNEVISRQVERSFSNTRKPQLLMAAAEAGTGKTTLLKRIGHSAARAGRTVLNIRTTSRIDTRTAVQCLKQATVPLLILVDDTADHAEQIAEILRTDDLPTRVVFLGAERSYRCDFVNVTLGPTRKRYHYLQPLSFPEIRQLVERYRSYGLLAQSEASRDPGQFARRLQTDPVSVAVCRILNDFRPLDDVIESLWTEAQDEDHLPYLAVALSQYCYSQGLRYSLLQDLLGPTQSAARMFDENRPLRLSINPVFDDLVVPMQSVIAERTLRRAISHNGDLLAVAFSRLARVLAGYVTRRTIKQRTPEARLAGRLFDADKVVRPLLGAAADAFFLQAQARWEWNSRYWEQRALMVVESDIETALRHARHAVSIETHSHPLTTLGKILFRSMEVAEGQRNVHFDEALAVLSEAIASEAHSARITIHPYTTLLNGTVRYLEMGGTLTMEQRDLLNRHIRNCYQEFAGDAALALTRSRVLTLMTH